MPTALAVGICTGFMISNRDRTHPYGAYNYSLGASLRWKPNSNLSLSLGPGYFWRHSVGQFIWSDDVTAGILFHPGKKCGIKKNGRIISFYRPKNLRWLNFISDIFDHPICHSVIFIIKRRNSHFHLEERDELLIVKGRSNSAVLYVSGHAFDLRYWTEFLAKFSIHGGFFGGRSRYQVLDETG